MYSNIGLSALCVVLAIMAFTVTILSACGIFQYIKRSDSRRKRIIRTVAMALVTIVLFISSYILFPKCPECNQTMDTEFCTNCGARVQEEYPTCPNCHVQVKTDYCGSCGHNMKGE